MEANMRDAFSLYHPAVVFCYFCVVAVMALLPPQPFAVLLPLLGGLALAGLRKGASAFCACLLFAILATGGGFLAGALVAGSGAAAGALAGAGAAAGAGALAGAGAAAGGSAGSGFLAGALAGGGAASGALAGAAICSVGIWFACCRSSMALPVRPMQHLGRLMPRLALMCSAMSRSIGRCGAQSRRFCEARSGARGAGRGGIFGQLVRTAAIMPALLAWLVKDSARTANLMLSRGYGLPGRGSCRIARCGRRDAAALCLLAAFAALMACSAIGTPSGQSWPWWAAAAHVTLYGLLCFVPFGISISEALIYKAGQVVNGRFHRQ
jgi:energy-coupling factor transporter transmembrane protein EcfT